MFWLTTYIWPGQHSLNIRCWDRKHRSVTKICQTCQINQGLASSCRIISMLSFTHGFVRYVKQIFRFYIFKLHIHNLLAGQHLLGTDHLLIRATTRYRLACSNLPLTSILTVYPVMLGWWSTTPPWTKALIKLPCRCEIDPSSFDCKSILTFWLSPMD